MYRVFIDVGHGGIDSGAVNGKLIEKIINLTVGLELKRLLILNGFVVHMSRESDIAVSLDKRCDMSNKWKADILVSIHHNAGGGDGYEVIHSIFHGVGERVAKLVSNEFAKLNNAHGNKATYSRANSAGNKDYYAIIRGTNAPAIITEFAFIDSKDREVIDTTEELLVEAEAIAKAVCNYFKVSFTAKAVKIGTVTASVLNIRPTANTEMAPIGTYVKGSKVEITDRKGDWLKAPKGWVHKDFIKF